MTIPTLRRRFPSQEAPRGEQASGQTDGADGPQVQDILSFHAAVNLL